MQQVEKQAFSSPVNFSSPTLLEESDSFPHSVTVEGVLSWPLWDGQFDDRLSLKQLLLRSNGEAGTVSPELEMNAESLDSVGQERLIRNYFDHFHIFNPVVDERQVADFRRDVLLNGYGWDAKSCLLVSSCSCHCSPRISLTLLQASSVCPRSLRRG